MNLQSGCHRTANSIQGQLSRFWRLIVNCHNSNILFGCSQINYMAPNSLRSPCGATNMVRNAILH
jgi:hypothetical protein